MSKPPGNAFANIEHFFVLMLENRSFDHMFGAQADLQSKPLTGSESCPFDPNDPSQPLLPITDDAPDMARPDTPHEFHDVCFQLTGSRAGIYPSGELPMHGFAASAREGLLRGESPRTKRKLEAERGDGAYALRGQDAASVPVLSELARQFVVCDAWHASMPGPTWPNRFFVHAASSGGLENSPSSVRSGAAVLLDKLGFDFKNGTIYDRLGAGNWRIYHDDPLPQVLAIKGMIKGFFGAQAQHFRRLKYLVEDLNSDRPPPKYVFIEPDHAILSSGRNGNSQHPEGLVSAGEALINTVYSAIRQSPVWEKSALIITYDEHGGFYDRMSPPSAIPPGDKALNRDKAEFPATPPFAFDRLGVRVPAVIVSPWVQRGAIDTTPYDHTSILRTLEERFDLLPLTERDRNAESFGHLFTLDKPCTDAPWNLDHWAPHPFGFARAFEEEALRRDVNNGAESEPDAHDEDNLAVGNLAGFLRIAMLADDLMQQQKAPPRSTVFKVASALFPALTAAKAPALQSRPAARAYIASVASRLQGVEEEQAQPAQ